MRQQAVITPDLHQTVPSVFFTYFIAAAIALVRFAALDRLARSPRC